MGEVITIGAFSILPWEISNWRISLDKWASSWAWARVMLTCTSRVFPEWKVYSEFITEHWNRALDLDAKKSSHPIEVECPNEDQINQVCAEWEMSLFGTLLTGQKIFDDLSYSKAASGKDTRQTKPQSIADKVLPVLRMLSAYVGEEKFLKGVSIYLQQHLYANSVSRDLWDGIGEATGKSTDCVS